MPDDNDLPGSALPLPTPVQDAITEFREPANLYRTTRFAAFQVLYEDLLEDVRKLLRSQNGGH